MKKILGPQEQRTKKILGRNRVKPPSIINSIIFRVLIAILEPSLVILIIMSSQETGVMIQCMRRRAKLASIPRIYSSIAVCGVKVFLGEHLRSESQNFDERI